MKMTVETIEHFRNSAQFLCKSQGAILDCFDDAKFKRELVSSIETVRAMSRILGQVEVQVKSK